MRKARLRERSDLPKAAWVDRAELRLGLRAYDFEFSALSAAPGLEGTARTCPEIVFPPAGTITREVSSPLQGHLAQGRNHIKSGINPECGTQPSSGGRGERAFMPGTGNGSGTLSWLPSMSCWQRWSGDPALPISGAIPSSTAPITYLLPSTASCQDLGMDIHVGLLGLLTQQGSPLLDG